MSWQFTLFVSLAPLAIATLILAIYFTSRHQSTPGVSAMIYEMVVVLNWVLFNTLELIAQQPYWTEFFAKVTYAFIALAPIAWFIFAAEYTGRGERVRPSKIFWLMIIPALTIIIAWTNPLHNLLWEYKYYIPQGNLLTFRAEYGFWFWVHAIYSYALAAIGSFWIIQHYLTSIRMYRRQSLWMVIGALLPLLYNMFYVLKLIPAIQKDYSSLAFAFGSLAYVMGISRYHLFDLVPISRSLILDRIRDAVAVLDHEDRIIDLNLAGQKIFNTSLRESIGRPVSSFPVLWNQLMPVWESENPVVEITREENGEARTYEIQLTRYSEKSVNAHKTLLIFHDVTERVALLQDVQELARTDPLSDLFNRRHFFEQINNELDRYQRYGTGFSLIMLDIDHFKTVNDVYGHLTGDQALIQVAEFCRKAMRLVDVLARYGGDEMIFLLPETGPQEAFQAAERLREGVENLEILVDGLQIPLTISLGVTSLVSGEKISLDTLLARVDRALYTSKEQGRNRTTVWNIMETER